MDENDREREVEHPEVETKGSDEESTQNHLNDPKQVLERKLKEMEKSSKDGHKKHNCLYCNKLYGKMPRHLEDMHQNEENVLVALSYKVGTKERQQKRIEIRREGDLGINLDAYQQNLEPVAVRKSKTTKEKLSCSGCRGWFVGRRLSKHNCFMKEERMTKDVAKSSRVFLATNAVNGEYREVEEKLVVGIRDPQLKLIIRNDKLLLALGAVELDHKDQRRYHDIRYTLCVVARLLVEFRNLTNDDMRAIDLLQPENYDPMLKAVKNMAGYKGRTNIDNPHFVVKFGHSLRTLILLGETMYTKSLSWDSVKKMQAMMHLYHRDYSNYANNAKVLYELKQGNVPEELPLEDDLKKFRDYCVTEIEELTTKEENLSYGQLTHLNKICFSRCLTFNARRGGEPGKLTLKQWGETLNDTWKHKADIDALTDPVEIKLAERLKLCYVPGKKKKKGRN